MIFALAFLSGFASATDIFVVSHFFVFHGCGFSNYFFYFACAVPFGFGKKNSFGFLPLIENTNNGSMFVVGASYLSLLQTVAARCGLPYASVVFERDGNGSPVYGIEIDVPCAGSTLCCRSFFFWAPMDATSGPGYKEAALQAIYFLQKLYGFVVVDYNF